MGIPTIVTSRLILRPFTFQDSGPLHRILGDRDVLRYFPNSASPSLDRVERMIAHQLEHWQEYGYGWWAVALTTTGEFIGWCGLQFLPKTEETEVGYLLGKPCWGQGLATEGAQASLLYGFEDIGLKTVVAIVHPENIASQRVIEKLGMSFTGQARYFGMPCYHYTIERTSAAGPDCHSQGGLFHDD